jgi:hypothetical protein
MITSRSGESVAWSNATLIASLKNTSRDGDLDQSQWEQAEPIIDKLATLYALDYVSQQDSNMAAEMLTNHSEDFYEFLRSHQILKDQSLKHAFHGNKWQFMKGYTKQIFHPRVQYLAADLSERAELEAMGYTMGPEEIGEDPHDPLRGRQLHPFVNHLGKTNDLMSMSLSFTNNKHRGTSVNQISKSLDLTPQEQAMVNAQLNNRKASVLRKMFSQVVEPIAPGKVGTAMIPQVSDTGDLLQYSYVMSESTKDNYMQQNNDYADIMGAMAGQIVDKMHSPSLNMELIDGLKAMYDAEYEQMPDNYVEISPYTTASPQMRELYYRIPKHTRDHIQRVWRQKKMYVAKDVLYTAFGYRHPTVLNSFKKASADRNRFEKMILPLFKQVCEAFGVHEVKAAHTIEELLADVTSLAKDNIVVKSLHVTLGNFLSNAVYLRMRGVPLSKILSLGTAALANGMKYQSDLKKVKDLQMQIATLQLKPNYDKAEEKELLYRLAKREDEIRRNPTTEFIESGGLPTITDDVEMGSKESPYMSRLEEMTQPTLEKLPTSVRNVGKVLLLDRDTTAYKILNNAVQMTDFVGRFVLYQHYLSEGKHSKPEAMAEVLEEFINFNLPTHPLVEYGNRHGFLWFTKFGLRILKPIYKSSTEKPFDFFMAYMTAAHFDFDNILDSAPTNIDMKIGTAWTGLLSTTPEILPINILDDILFK